MVLNLTPAEQKLLVHVLRMAADKFAANSCNDLELVRDAHLTPEQSLEVRTAMVREGDYPDDDVQPNRHYTMDWLVMMHFANKIAKCGPAGVEG